MKRFYGAMPALLFSALLGGTLRAQQSIFNVPTTDIFDKGKVYVELNAAFKLSNQDALNKFSRSAHA